MEKLRDLIKQLLALRFIKFVLSGGMAFLIDTSVLLTVKYLIFKGNDVTILGTISVAKLISSTAGILFMFIANRTWVFIESRKKSLPIQGAKYITITIINLIIANILYGFYFPFLTLLFPMTNPSVLTVLSNLLTEATKLFISFFAYKYLVFR